jgi:predicted ATPase
VGRSEASRTLGSARDRSGERRFLLAIEGEAGIGKSYLADSFLATVAARGGRTLSARCYPDEHHLPYGPFLDLLRSALVRPDATARLAGVESRWLSEASRLAPDLVHLLPGLAPPPPLDGPVGRNHLFEGVDRVLSALLAGAQPGVLLLDDAHWADPATLELLAYLARPERPPGLLLLLALRPERNEAHGRLQRLLVAGEREGRADQLTLERWGRDEVEELLRRHGAELDAEGAARLFEESEGLPFFVSEYLAALARHGAWGELPQGVRDLLHSRLGAASPVEQQLLQTAATIGRSFDFDLLRRASGRVDDEVVAGLERLVALDLVREVDNADGSIRFDFGHEKLRALVYDEASLIRRRLLHGRIADTLLAEGAAPRRPAPAGLIGSHLRLAGREPQAALQFAQAGDQARSLFANEEALHHYRTALALGHPNAAGLHEAIGDLHTLAGAYDLAITDFETAAATGNTDRLGQLEHKLGNVHQRRGAWETAESHYRAAEASIDGADARAGARLLADRSLNAQRRDRADEAQGLAERALSLAERSDDTTTLAQVHNLLGMLAHRRGDLATSAHALALSLALTADAADPSARIAALNNLALVRAEAGDPDAGLDLLEEALTLCRRQGDRHREAALLTNSADLHHAGGRDDEAMALLKRSAALYAAIDERQGDRQPEIWKLVAW